MFRSSLTNKLMVRVCNYFDSQLHVPVPLDRASVVRTRTSKKSQDGPDTQIIDQRPMDTEEMLVWFGKILDAVKMRYRKLQRFAR
jgi:mitogen-activated protein kinase kinase kinase